MDFVSCLSPSTPDRSKKCQVPAAPLTPVSQKKDNRTMMTFKLARNAVNKTKRRERGPHDRQEPWVRRFMDTAKDEEERRCRHKALFRALNAPRSIIKRVEADYASKEGETDFEHPEDDNDTDGHLSEIELVSSIDTPDNLTIVKRFRKFYNPWAADKADYDKTLTQYDHNGDLGMTRLPVNEQEKNLASIPISSAPVFGNGDSAGEKAGNGGQEFKNNNALVRKGDHVTINLTSSAVSSLTGSGSTSSKRGRGRGRCRGGGRVRAKRSRDDDEYRPRDDDSDSDRPKIRYRKRGRPSNKGGRGRQGRGQTAV